MIYLVVLFIAAFVLSASRYKFKECYLGVTSQSCFENRIWVGTAFVSVSYLPYLWGKYQGNDAECRFIVMSAPYNETIMRISNGLCEIACLLDEGACSQCEIRIPCRTEEEAFQGLVQFHNVTKEVEKAWGLTNLLQTTAALYDVMVL